MSALCASQVLTQHMIRKELFQKLWCAAPYYLFCQMRGEEGSTENIDGRPLRGSVPTGSVLDFDGVGISTQCSSSVH